MGSAEPKNVIRNLVDWKKEVDSLSNQLILQENKGDRPALDKLEASKKVLEQELFRLVDEKYKGAALRSKCEHMN